MLKTFIERPVLSTVISIIILMLGFISISSLPIEQYPDITLNPWSNHPTNPAYFKNSTIINAFRVSKRGQR